MTSLHRQFILVAILSLVLAGLYATLLIPAEGNANPVISPSFDTSGNLYISSVPEGAEILVDQVPTGYTTPHLVLDLPAGIHRITVTCKGYFSQTKEIDIIPGKTTKIHFVLESVPVELKSPQDIRGFAPSEPSGGGGAEGTDSSSDSGSEPGNPEKPDSRPNDKTAYGTVRVTSSPGNAKITMDGKDTGLSTPATFKEVPAGPHSFAVSLDGYQDAQKNVPVITQIETEVHFDLVPVGHPVPEFPSVFFPVCFVIGLLFFAKIRR